MFLFPMIESVIIPVKTGSRIFVIMSEAKALALGDENYVAAKRRKNITRFLLYQD